VRKIILSRDSLRLTPVTEDDYELLMAWRSHPDVYKHFSQQSGPLVWEEHYRFWNSRQDRIDWIINYNDGIRDRKVGSINVASLSSESPEIGIFIGEVTLMGKGIGKAALGLVLEWLEREGYDRACAHISKQNTTSQRLFSSHGFKIAGEIHEGVEWVYVLEFGE
jgi:ribosomal-protein-alanine N-acetyltransferase